MRFQVKRRRRSVRLVTVLVVVAGSTAFVFAASAAFLGGVSQADLYVFSGPDTVPLPLAFDHFDACAGNLNNDVDVVGNSWLAPTADWRCQSAASRVRNRKQTTTADSATVDVGQSDHVVLSTFVNRASRTVSAAGSGLSLFHDGSSFHLYVVYQRGADQITLGKVDGSGDTEIASWSWLPRNNTIDFLVEIDQPEITIYADSMLVANYTMTASELTTFGSNTRFGLESDFDGRSRWSWFRVEELVP